MKAVSEVQPTTSTCQTGDVFVLYPTTRPGARLALTGPDLLRLKAVLDRFAATAGQDELLGDAEALADKLGGYFAGLK